MKSTRFKIGLTVMIFRIGGEGEVGGEGEGYLLIESPAAESMLESVPPGKG